MSIEFKYSLKQFKAVVVAVLSVISKRSSKSVKRSDLVNTVSLHLDFVACCLCLRFDHLDGFQEVAGSNSAAF